MEGPYKNVSSHLRKVTVLNAFDLLVDFKMNLSSLLYQRNGPSSTSLSV